MKIEEIEKDFRPREKLIKSGADKLSDRELLAILLSVGNKNESVMDLSKRLIEEYGLKRLFNMSYNELKEINGIKEAKATKLMAVFEIARRITSIDDKIYIDNPYTLYDFIKNDYLYLDEEKLSIIYVNSSCKFISKKSYTNNNHVKVDINYKDIVLDSINLKAYGIFLVHNHPSGNINPSENDLRLTDMILKALAPLNIKLLDHLIINDKEFFSIMDKKKYIIKKKK